MANIAKKTEFLVTAQPPSEHMERAAKINYYHNVGQQGAALALEAAFRCGMELFQSKLEHPGTFERWIEENCEFGRAMAYRYLALVQKALSADDLPRISNGSEKAKKSAIAEILSTSDSKTVTELFCEYGVMTKTKSNLGGKREGAGRKSKEEKAKAALAAQAAAQDGELAAKTVEGMISELYRVLVIEDTIGDLDEDKLKGVHDSLWKIFDKVNNRLQKLVFRNK